MNKFADIDIRVETPPPLESGNLLPVLNEVRHGLQRLLDGGEETVIDLLAMPFAPGELERLLGRLEGGEVNATVDALGETRVRESRYSGVWVVDHYNTEGQRIALQIEITELPQMLRSPREEIAEAAERLTAELEEQPT